MSVTPQQFQALQNQIGKMAKVMDAIVAKVDNIEQRLADAEAKQLKKNDTSAFQKYEEKDIRNIIALLLTVVFAAIFTVFLIFLADMFPTILGSYGTFYGVILGWYFKSKTDERNDHTEVAGEEAK